MLKKYTYSEHDFFNDAGFRFFIGTSIVKQPVFEQHLHQFAELAIILGGTALHRVDSEAYPIGKGDVFVINTRTSHGFTGIQDMRICNIMYDPVQFLGPFTDLVRLPGFHALFTFEPAYRAQDRFRSRLQLTASGLADAESIVNSLVAEQQARGAGYRTAIRTKFIELVLFLCRRYSQNPGDASRRLLRLGTVIAHLETHYMKTLRLLELAAMAHLSVNQFLRVFKNLYHKTPTQYLVEVRIKKAGELLTGSKMSVTDIAYEVGFSDSNYFSRVFRRIVGTTPRDYRNTGLPVKEY